MKKTTIVLNSSASGLHQGSQDSRHLQSLRCSQIRKMSSLSSCRSKSKLNNMNRTSFQKPPKTTAVVLDDDGNDVTPLPLYHPKQEDKPKSNFLEDIFSISGTDYSKSTSSFNLLSSSSFMASSGRSRLSTKVTDESPKLDLPIDPPTPCMVLRKRENVKQHVTEVMLDEVVDIYLTETDNISLLDIPSTLMSEDADDADDIKEKNIHYAELCKNRMGNDKYVARPMQTFSGAPKNKQIQSESIVMVDEGTMATKWDIYDFFFYQHKTSENEKADSSKSAVNISKDQRKREEMSSSTSTVGTDSTVSSLPYCSDTEMCGNSLNVEPGLHPIMLSESFKCSLLVMERNIVANIFQPKLAVYRQLPILEDPDSKVKPGTEEQSEGEESFSSSPALKHLWTFSCKLTSQCNITCMTWNKENPDFLAVGYGDCDSSTRKPGLICCWSLKNPTWPKCVFQCRSCVTSLDFSEYNPGQLAVGMYDGTVAIYNVQHQRNNACIASSSECSKKHLKPVWQVTWMKEERGLSGDHMVEVLVSVSADGRITEWLQSTSCLDCKDLMKLSRIKGREKKAAGKKKTTQTILSRTTPALCLDFHPINSSIYLAGTGEGFIHKCSLTNSEHFLDTYQKHFCPVNHIEWSPFCPDVFLSCSSDWTIQLWKQDCLTPVLSFTHTQRAVCTARWSPNWSTIFAAINEQQVEIWDLNSSILHPTIVHHAAPGVTMTSLLFTKGTDCVLVGDSDGQVTVFQLLNLSVGQGKQVATLEDIIQSAASQ